MATRYNTGNPVPSNTMMDLSDNVQVLDEFVNNAIGNTTLRTGAVVPVLQEQVANQVAASIDALTETAQSAVSDANGAKSDAQAAKNAAVTAKDDATTAQSQAESARDQAQAAAQAAISAGNIQPDKETGLAGGEQFFTVGGGEGASVSYVTYENVNGEAVVRIEGVGTAAVTGLAQSAEDFNQNFSETMSYDNDDVTSHTFLFNANNEPVLKADFTKPALYFMGKDISADNGGGEAVDLSGYLAKEELGESVTFTDPSADRHVFMFDKNNIPGVWTDFNSRRVMVMGRDTDRPRSAAAAIAAARYRCVDLVMIGDSNQLHSGYGFGGAYPVALYNRYGQYASAIHSMRNEPVTTTGTTDNNTGGTGGTSLDSTAAPDALRLQYNERWPHSAGYLPEGQTFASNSNGTILYPTNPMLQDKTNLRAWFKYGMFASETTPGTGNFLPYARYAGQGGSYGNVVLWDKVVTVDGTSDLKLLELPIPAGDYTANGIEVKWAGTGSRLMTGPFFGLYSRVDNPNANKGISCHTLYGAGGQSLWDMSSSLTADFDNAKAVVYFGELRRLQLLRGQMPIIVIYINSGLNDQNETSTPSFGWRATTDSKSATAYIDNLEYLCKRFEDVWEQNGWNKEELFFLIHSSHMVNDPDTQRVQQFRQAAQAFAAGRERITAVDLTNITSSAFIYANDWYYGQTSTALSDRDPTTGAGVNTNSALEQPHLKQEGYDAIVNLVLNHVIIPCEQN